MSIMRFRFSAASAAVFVIAGSLLLAHSEAGAQATPFAAGAGVSWESYGFGTEDAANLQRLSLFTVPVSAQFGLGSRTRLAVRGAFAEGVLVRANGTSETLSGPVDTEVRLGFDIGSPHRSLTTLSAVVLLPTGNSTHTLGEAEVAGAIASELLPFRIHHWGTGGGMGASAGTSYRLARGSIGASASYLVAREFEPVQVDGIAPFVYRPGNQLQLRASVEQAVGETGKAALALTIQHHDEDELAGINLYRAGMRYHAMASYAFATGPQSSGILYAGGLHRSRGEVLMERLLPVPAQDLLLAGVGLRTRVGRSILLPALDARLHRSEDGVGQGYLVGLGSSLELPAGNTTLVPSARVRAGNLVVRSDQETTLVGFEVGLSARLGRR
jgi:hypothetical protein